MNSKPNHWCPYKENKGFIDTKSRKPREDRGRDWRDAAAEGGMPRRAGDHRELGEAHGADSPLSLRERINPADTLIFEQTSEFGEEKKSVF